MRGQIQQPRKVNHALLSRWRNKTVQDEYFFQEMVRGWFFKDGASSAELEVQGLELLVQCMSLAG